MDTYQGRSHGELAEPWRDAVRDLYAVLVAGPRLAWFGDVDKDGVHAVHGGVIVVEVEGCQEHAVQTLGAIEDEVGHTYDEVAMFVRVIAVGEIHINIELGTYE
jgi:hypothetical protein